MPLIRRPVHQPGFTEFVILIAMMMSLVALSIDSMLPALPDIETDLDSTHGPLVILMFFAGMSVGQLVFGPWSDASGRRPAIIVGSLIFIVGCVLSLIADSFEAMLLGRFIQGLGASAPRIVSIAVVRDRFEGEQMARVMSLTMMVFILVPVFAPALGQLILLFADWRSIFGIMLFLVIVVTLWFATRQPETLHAESRIPLSVANLKKGLVLIFSQRLAVGNMIVMGMVFGAFVGYLSSSQLILQQQYELGTLFPLYFGILAASIGLASLVNSRLVLRFGMRRLASLALGMVTLLSLLFLLVGLLFAGHPPLWQLMAYLLVVFFFNGILFGNLQAMAMSPLGEVAGLGSAIIGSVSTLVSVLLGTAIASAYNGTIFPLVIGFALLSLSGWWLLSWTYAPHSTDNLK